MAEATISSRRKPDWPKVAYFSMEVALSDALPIFSGGLGVLAGDFLTSAADHGRAFCAVSLAYRSGYFRQTLDDAGRQAELPVSWSFPDVLEPMTERVSVSIEGRTVVIGVWRYRVVGDGGAEVPLYLLDTDLAENTIEDRRITDRLYGGDLHHRLVQEVVLGIGGAAMLATLGHGDADRFHMNEGHASLLGLYLLEQEMGAHPSLSLAEALERVRARGVFTTHTPVPAGHDRFPSSLVQTVLGTERTEELTAMGVLEAGELNMTELGMACSGYVNAVSLRHGAVSQEMFPDVRIHSITNAVHHLRWTAPSMAALFDERIECWRRDPALLRYAVGIEPPAVDAAHRRAKTELFALVRDRTGTVLDPAALTIGIARRATPYKQSDLLLSDPNRLLEIAERHGPLQIVFAAKAHPADEPGKELIRRIIATASRLRPSLPVVFLADYGLQMARLLVSGSDIWLNTPLRPREASGTSGMKAALNGVPSLSVLDGWWIEGWIEGETGWAIGTADDKVADDAENLYTKLGEVVAPLYYEHPERFAKVRRGAIALNGSYFNTDRMLNEYTLKAYTESGAQRVLER